MLILLATVVLTLLSWQLRGLFVILMVVVVLAALIALVVNWTEQFKLSRWLSAIVIYLSLLAGLQGVGELIGSAIAGLKNQTAGVVHLKQTLQLCFDLDSDRFVS